MSEGFNAWRPESRKKNDFEDGTALERALAKIHLMVEDDQATLVATLRAYAATTGEGVATIGEITHHNLRAALHQHVTTANEAKVDEIEENPEVHLVE